MQIYNEKRTRSNTERQNIQDTVGNEIGNIPSIDFEKYAIYNPTETRVNKLWVVEAAGFPNEILISEDAARTRKTI